MRWSIIGKYLPMNVVHTGIFHKNKKKALKESYAGKAIKADALVVLLRSVCD